MIHSHGFSYYCNADDTQLYLSFPPDYFAVSARISDCLFDISAWMKAHHLQLNLSKTEPLFVPAKPTIKHELSIKIDSISLSPTKVARNLEVMMDASVTRLCRFSLFNTRKIRPYLKQQATQLLVQTMVIPRLDYCNTLLTGLPPCAVIPLHCLVFNQPRRVLVTPC